MALVGEMQYLTIGGNTYSLPSGGGGTVTSVAVSNDTNGGLTVSGSPITSSGTVTIGHSNVLASAQTTQAVYPIKIDKNGHISEYGSAVSIPTKVSDLTNDSGFVTTDNKLEIDSNLSNATYYPIIATNSTTAATRKYDVNGFKYAVSNGTTSSSGSSKIILGNATSVNEAGNKQGIIRLYGLYNGYVDISLSTYTTTGRTLTIPDATGTIALTSDIPTVPSSTDSTTTGITIADHSTNSIYGVSSSTTSVYGVSSSTTTASKVTVGSHSTDYGVTAAGSGSASLTFTMDTTDTKKLKIAFSHTHTAPTLGSKVPTVTASDVTVPIKNADATTVPIKNSSATTVVTSATHSVTDTGHTHTIGGNYIT